MKSVPVVVCSMGVCPLNVVVVVQSLSVVSTLCDPMDWSTPGFPVLHYLLEFAQTHVTEVMMSSNHLVLCRPLLLLPSIFPSIRVFSNESTICIRWPMHWSCSFSISPSNKYSGLISFRINWLDLLAIKGTFENLLRYQFESIYSLALSLLYGPTLTNKDL